MSKYDSIHLAHHELALAVEGVAKPGVSLMPVTLVSVNDRIEGQMVLFDGSKFSEPEVAKRLRAAADFVERECAKAGGQ